MARKSKKLEAKEEAKDLEVETVQVETTESEAEPETVEVTLKKNGFVDGKLYRTGETVMVTPKLRDYLVKTSPEVYQS